jgi:hypothetical protein
MISIMCRTGALWQVDLQSREGALNMKAILVVAALAFFVPAIASGQTVNHDHMKPGGHAGMMGNGALPRETGQSAFAAIQDIVDLLSANPATDWSRVDIEALRQHLIDMNNVTLGAIVDVKQLDGSLQFSVTGEGPVGESIKRMVVAHAAAMNGIDGWKYAAKESATGAILSVTPPDLASMVKLRALGFIGIMSLGMHHQQHHWMLATGMQPHE